MRPYNPLEERAFSGTASVDSRFFTAPDLLSDYNSLHEAIVPAEIEDRETGGL
jgi:hypothetical protein